MDVIIRTKLIDFKSLISCWRLENILLNVHKTPVECFEYMMAPGRQPPRYHDRFNAVLPVLMYYFCFTNVTTRYPNRDHSPAVTKLLIEHRVARPPHSIGILTLENWQPVSSSLLSCITLT